MTHEVISMPFSVHNRLQKLEADIAALELKQHQLKERITHRVIHILDQEQAFAIDPPLLLGAIVNAIRKVHTINASTEKTHLNEKTKLTELGHTYLKQRRFRRSNQRQKPS